MFLYSLFKTAANAVLKLMSAVIATAQDLFVKEKSVSIMLLEYSFGKLKYDSTTLSMSGSLGLSSVSASRLPVSLAIFNFSKYFFRVGKSYPHNSNKKSIDVPVDRIPDINKVGRRKEQLPFLGCPGGILFIIRYVFLDLAVYVLNCDTGSF